MKKADKAAGENPPYGVYWVRKKEIPMAFVSFIAGPCCIPFTIWAFHEWKRLS